MNSKEKYAEVYKTADSLNANMEVLRMKSGRLYGWMRVMALLPLVVYCLLFFVVFRDQIGEKEANEAIPMMVSYVVFLLCFYIVSRKYIRLRLQFEEVKRICGELSDMVDWTSMRKRQVYNNTIDPKIQVAIDEFYEYTMSTSCPFYGGKKRYRWLRMVAMTELLAIMVFSLLVTFGLVNF